MRNCLFLWTLPLCVMLAAGADPALVAEYEVRPLTQYQLSFEADAETRASWEVRILDGDGRLPHSGCFKEPWQTIQPDRQEYRQWFYSPAEGVKLQLLCTSEEAQPAFNNVRLDEVDSGNLVINGDFAGGLNNYSGWRDRAGATLVEEKGRTVLRIVPGGYALTDPIPVMPGAVYAFPPGALRRGQMMVYDQTMLRIDDLPPYHHINNTTFTMPAEAAYVRMLFFIKWPHLESSISLTNVGLMHVEGEAAATAAPSATEQEIVLAADADMIEERAARELQHWLYKIGGRKLPVLAKPSAADNVKLYVGTTWAERYPEDLDFLGESDGYAVRRDGKAIYIFGTKPAGVLFGAIRFLEENTDIIWARPHEEFGTVYSTQDGVEFAVSDFRSRPAFPARAFSFPGGLPMTDTLFWMSRLGLNTSVPMKDGFNRDMGGHTIMNGSFFSYIFKVHPFAELKESHPEFFPMIDGKRMIKEHWLNPCFSNPEVVKTLIAGLRIALAEAPEKLDYLSCFQADTWRVCSCDSCMTPIQLPDGSILAPKSPYSEEDSRFFSTRMFMMMNEAADVLMKEYPDLKLVTHAYIYSAEPPAVAVHPALKPQYAAYSTRTLRYPILDGDANGAWGDIWEKRYRTWLERHEGKGLSVFSYYNLNGFSAVADAAASDFRELAKAGGFLAHTESCPDVEFPNNYTGNGDPYSYIWDVDAMERWVLARLMWDPSQEPQELREYYMQRSFREAAEPMMKFHALVRASWLDPKIDKLVNCHISQRDLFTTFIVEPGNEERARTLLVEAEKAAVHPVSKQLVQRILSGFDRLSARLNREAIPWVPESTHDWNAATSTHWEKAIAFTGFGKVDDWRVFDRAPAEHQTEVRTMCDRENLYFRIVAWDDAVDKVVVAPYSATEQFPNGDRVEIVLTDGSKHWYFTIGPNGNRYDARGWEQSWESDWQVETTSDKGSWTAMAAIPMAALDIEPGTTQLQARFGRVYRLRGDEREESSLAGASIYNRHESFWTTLLIGKEEQ